MCGRWRDCKLLFEGKKQAEKSLWADKDGLGQWFSGLAHDPGLVGSHATSLNTSIALRLRRSVVGSLAVNAPTERSDYSAQVSDMSELSAKDV